MITSINSTYRRLCPVDSGDLDLWLTRFNGEAGILRCQHVAKDTAISVLRAIDRVAGDEVIIETLSTSGTIKTLTRGVLKAQNLNNPRPRHRKTAAVEKNFNKEQNKRAEKP